MKKTIASIIFTICSSLTFAQNISTYSGQMTMSETFFYLFKVPLEGEGYYEYYVDSSGKRIKHGKYSFVNYNEKIDRARGFNDLLSYIGNFSAEGRFENGKKVGRWTINWDAKTYSIDYNEDNYDGDFKVYSRLKNHDDKVVCHFKNGCFVGKYYAEGDWVIKGQFDDDGFVDGVWSVIPKAKSPYAYYFEFSHGAYLCSYGYDDSTGERFELGSKTLHKEGRSSDESIFGPSVLVYYNNESYIEFYLNVPEFKYTVKPFLYVPDDGEIPYRADYHNSQNALKLMAENESKRLEKEKKEAELAEWNARPELAQPADSLMQFLQPLFTYPEAHNKALTSILSKAGSCLRFIIPIQITKDGYTKFPVRHERFDRNKSDNNYAFQWNLTNAKFYLLETTGLKEEDQAAKEIGAIIDAILPKLKDAPKSRPGRNGSRFEIYVNFAGGRIDIWASDYLRKL